MIRSKQEQVKFAHYRLFELQKDMMKKKVDYNNWLYAQAAFIAENAATQTDPEKALEDFCNVVMTIHHAVKDKKDDLGISDANKSPE